MKIALICMILYCCSLPELIFSQDQAGSFDKMLSFPGKLINDINKKTSSLESQLTNVSTSYLKNLCKRENKLKKKLSKLDSADASRLFPAGIQNQYTNYIKSINSDSATRFLKYSGI